MSTYPLPSKSTGPRITPATAKALVGFCWGALLGVWLLERQVSEAFWLGTLFAYAPQVVWLVPVALAVVAAFLARDRVAAGMAVILAILAVIFLLGFNLATPTPSRGGQRLTVVTWNVDNQFKRADEFRAQVDRLGADVVLLQEAYDRQWRRTFSDWQGVPWHEGWIFTRGKIVSSGSIVMGDGWRPGCWARLRLGSREISILSVHVTSVVTSHMSTVVHQRQIDSCVDWASRQTGPYIVAGDFNTPANSQSWTPLRAIAQDSFATRGLGFGYTFSSILPLWRIDYVWASHDFGVLRCGTFGGRLSDHRGVWAEMEALP
jgi:endonuclease/exonuclease/phosphatase (EEP) superfamily protein YafD